MIRSLYSFGFVLLVGALLVSCTDQPAPTAALEDDTSVLLEASKNGPPASSGPHVIRYEGIATVFIVDPKTGVAAFFGGDIVAICSGDPTGFDPVSIKDIDVPEDANRINQMIKGRDVRASYWDSAPTDCADVLAVGPVATGTGDFVSTDNDLNVFLNPDNRNANAFGVNFNGQLETVGGETIGMNAHSRCVWDGNDGDTLKCNDKVNVR